MNPDDTVLGFVIEDCAWAIPWWAMKNHHAANLTLKDQPLLITMCEACASASAFKRTVNGRIHRFEVEGSYNATPVLCDIEKHSLWAMFSGEALFGPLEGSRLDRLPLFHSTWQEWKSLFPTRCFWTAVRKRGKATAADLPVLK